MGLFSKKKEPEQPSQPVQPTGKDELESLAPEIPPPPSDISEQVQAVPQTRPETKQTQGHQPSFPSEILSMMGMKASDSGDEKKEFELPDFDDSDMFKEEPPIIKKEPEKKPEPVIEQKPPPPPPPPEPVEDLKHRFTEQKESFLYVFDYINAKDAMEQISKLLSETSQGISNHAAESKAKDETYATLIKELNVLQEKLMEIDNKLFEETNS